MDNIKKVLKPDYLYPAGLYIIAFILIFSGMSKVLDPDILTGTLQSLNILPDVLIIILSVTLPVLEILIGIILLTKLHVRLILMITILLFAAFWIYSIFGILTGLNNECGCFGSIIRTETGWGMLVRNSILLTIVILLYKNSMVQNAAEK